MAPRNILLLGLGMQGKAALHDLVHQSDAYHITVVDSRPDRRRTWLATLRNG